MGKLVCLKMLCLLIILLFSVKSYAHEPCTALNCTALTFDDAFLLFGNRARDRVFSDFGNFYSPESLKCFGGSLLLGGLLANTEMDHNFQRWHNRQVRSKGTDNFARVTKFFGEGQIFIPIATTCAVAYRFRQEQLGFPDHPLGDFACRTTRGYLTGAPTLILFQSLLGAGRPVNSKSYWRPFRNPNAISGHAYIGAVPFITAAQMSDNIYVKGLFYSFSTLTAWGRVNDDGHYLSQAVLGWYLAYLSVKAVSNTQESRLPKGMTLFPVAELEGVGMGVFYRF